MPRLQEEKLFWCLQFPYSFKSWNLYENGFAFTCLIVDGGWSGWSAFGHCSVTCGNGYKTRTRSCSNPAPAHDGADCHGDALNTHICREHHCPSKNFDQIERDLKDFDLLSRRLKWHFMFVSYLLMFKTFRPWYRPFSSMSIVCNNSRVFVFCCF